MFRTNNNFDKLLDKATSNLRLDPDWPSILQICDLIRQNDCNPKYAVTAIKKKITSQNPHQAMFALLVLESIVKNCGSGVHDEVASVTNCESYRGLVKSTEHENVRTKMLELLQAWAFAFRNITKYRTVQDAVNILKAEGYKFPQLKESDAMFSADSAPEWADGDVCNRCRVQFSLVQRKHHCRACGQVFCQQCSAKTATLPKFGIEKEVRVCDACLDQVTKAPNSNVATKAEPAESPASFVSTAQESQPPARKSAEELQEEEEFQLALALSQSEAEQKEKERQRAPPAHVTPVSTQHHVSPATTQHHQSHGSPPSSAPPAELSRYLDRNYWEQRVQPSNLQLDPPSAPTPSPGPAPNSGLNDVLANKISLMKLENGSASDPEMEEFITTLKSQVEIFVNRMKSNSSRGRSIANDSSVQTLFMNITTMHSRLLRYIQQQDDNRVHYEKLQDKLTQVKDSRAALDVLREEHAERLRRIAEQAELQRQLQMAHKLDVMRKKKQEYLQYQRQLALQRVQEQEREMQMRQEQQKHQYMLGGTAPFFMQGSPVHQFHSPQQQQQFNPGYSPMLPPGMHQTQQMVPDAHNMIRQTTPQAPQAGQIPQQNIPMQPPSHLNHIPSMNMQLPPMSQSQQIGQGGQVNSLPQMGQLPPGMSPHGTMIRPGMNMNQLPHLNISNQHVNQNPQGPQNQLPHQPQLNKQPQVNMQNLQGIQQPSQMPMQGPQPLQQPQHMGPQGPQMNPQGIGQMQQIPQHGQGIGAHQLPHMGQQPQINQSLPQVNQQNQQGVGQPNHQLHAKGVPMMYMDPQMNQQMGQMMQQMSQQGPHMGQIPNLNQNMPPGHLPQSMGVMNNQMPPGQMVGQQVPQLNQGMNQNQAPQNNQPTNVQSAMDQKNVNKQLGNLSPTSAGSNQALNNHGSPVPAVVNQIAVNPPQQQQPIPKVEESSTAELISFD